MKRIILLITLSIVSIILGGCSGFHEIYYDGMDALVFDEVRYICTSGDCTRADILGTTPDGDCVYSIENDKDNNYLLAGGFKSWYLYKKESFKPKHSKIISISLGGEYYNDQNLIKTIERIIKKYRIKRESVLEESDDAGEEFNNEIREAIRIRIKYNDDPVGEVLGDVICIYGEFYIAATGDEFICITEEEYDYIINYSKRNW